MLFQVPTGQKEAELPAMDSASIVICIHGSAQVSNQTLAQDIAVRRGTILFIAASEKVVLKIQSDDGMLVYRAHAGC